MTNINLNLNLNLKFYCTLTAGLGSKSMLVAVRNVWTCKNVLL